MWAGLANNDSWCFFILKYGWSLEAEGLQSKPLHLSKRILYLVDSPPGILRGFTISGVFWLFGAFHPFSRFSRVTGEEEVAGKRQTANGQMGKSRFLPNGKIHLQIFCIILATHVEDIPNSFASFGDGELRGTLEGRRYRRWVNIGIEETKMRR